MINHERAATTVQQAASNLGPLAQLPGRWVGKGFNMIAVPQFPRPAIFRLIVNPTNETLTFTDIGGAVPNRGFLQPDINIFGVTYLQQVSDSSTNSPIHIEPGIWLNVPPTTAPTDPSTVVRQSTIPHGDSVLAQGPQLIDLAGPPPIDAVNPLPTLPDGTVLGPPYTDPYNAGPFPPGFSMANPNQALVDALNAELAVGVKVVNTTTLKVDSKNSGGVSNIPFVVTNANAIEVTSTFWIETMQRPNGSQFLQLQYTQTVFLEFDGVIWPHVSVATLIKQ